MGLAKLLRVHRKSDHSAKDSKKFSASLQADPPQPPNPFAQESPAQNLTAPSSKEPLCEEQARSRGALSSLLFQMSKSADSSHFSSASSDTKSQPDASVPHAGPDKESTLLADGSRFFKILVMGAPRVGKTCFVENFVDGSDFIFGSQFPTLEDTFEHVMKIDGYRVILHIIDTAGNEFKSGLFSAYIRRCNACILIYSIDDDKSFLHLHQLHKDLMTIRGEQFPVFVVGNKLDLIHENPALRQITAENLEQFGKLYKCGVMEYSSKISGTGSCFVFSSLVSLLINLIPFKDKIAAYNRKIQKRRQNNGSAEAESEKMTMIQESDGDEKKL